MHSPLVTVIIVNWNGEHLLKDCLGSLSRVEYKNIEILFVDNASSDNSVAYVKKKYPNIRILQNRENLGYAEGHEEAFTKARGEAVLMLSTDTIVEKNLLTVLISTLFKEKSIGGVQPAILMYPDKHLIDSIGSFFLKTGILYHFGREKNINNSLYKTKMEIFSAKGACMMFKKEVLEKTGLFDKDYFAYFEDTDLCHRVWLSGYSIWYEPGTTIYHKGGGAAKQIASSYIQFHAFKNRISTYLKNLSIEYLIFVIPTTIFIYCLLSVVYIFQRKFSIAWAVQKSIWWNISNLPKILRKRALVQNTIRKVEDREFLSKLTRPVRLSYYYYLFKGLGLYKDK